MNETVDVPKVEEEKVANDPTGRSGQRVPQGLLVGLGILAMVAFWGIFAYAIWVEDLQLVTIFAYIIAIGAGVYGTIHFLSKLYQHLSRS